jgi:copper transport protein
LLATIPAAEERKNWVKQTAKRYSVWAAGSLLVVMLTGILMTVDYASSWNGFLNSAWGNSILVKVILLALIAILGYFQYRFVKKGNIESIGSFVRKGRWEIAVGLVAVLVASFLIDFSPIAAERGVTPTQVEQEGMTASMNIDPFLVGYNDIDITITGRTDIQEVNVRFQMPPEYDVVFRAFNLGNGQYRIVGNQLHAPESTSVKVEARTEDGKVIVFPFEVEMPGVMYEYEQ